jgi:peptide/nickel transport system permease protein
VAVTDGFLLGPPDDARSGQGPSGRQRARAHNGAGRLGRAAIRPVLGYLVTVIVVVLLIFGLPRAVPGDPLARFLDSEDHPLPPVEHARMTAYYGLDKPLVGQFTHYVSRLAHGDLGDSISSSAPVSTVIRENLPWTMLLSFTALLISSVLGLMAGIDAAWGRGGFRDRRLLVLMTALHAIPDFVIGVFLLIGLGVVLPIFPLGTARTPFHETASLLWKVSDIVRHMVLPVTALTLSLLGTKFLLVRNSTISVLGQDYMVLARAKGLSEHRTKYHHAGRNSLLPFLAVLGFQIGFVFGGSLIVETVFGYPGMASVLQRAVENLDYPLLQGSFLMLALVVLTANLLVDLASVALDPRFRAE